MMIVLLESDWLGVLVPLTSPTLPDRPYGFLSIAFRSAAIAGLAGGTPCPDRWRALFGWRRVSLLWLVETGLWIKP
jgi:hypothetical protein